MAESPLLEEHRENWGSRAGFVLAAIGSAVGLGNLWGFPYKLYAYGGGAFLIPYLLAMLVIGIPLLILEFSLGHMTQRAAPDAYRAINRKTEPVGWWGILLGFVIITYYPVILAYCAGFLVECIKSIVTGEALPWAGRGLEGVANAKTYYFKQYLQMWPDDYKGNAWDFGRPIWWILTSLVVVWGLMYLCIFRGVKLVSKVVLWTVPLPWIMLLVLAVRGLTLEGSQQGLNFYLDPDWSKLFEPETWRWAFGQMFFSMSLAFGVMITYASFLHRKSDINNNATIIGLADVGTSFMAGIAVFATLGGMALATQQAAELAGDPKLAVAVESVVDKGPGLAFVAFPYALAQLPAAAYFGVVFFLALLLLGIDSAFSITESVLASLVDKTGWNRGRVLIGMSLVGLGFGLVYCTRGGLIWLDFMDSFINSTWGGIALLGLLEFVVVGWGYRLRRLRAHANERSDWRLGIWWEWIVRYVAPTLLGLLFSWSVIDRTAAAGGFLYAPDGKLVVPVLFGLIIAGLAPLLSLILSVVHSPGADSHAPPADQPRHGKVLGAVATLVVLGAVAGVGYAGREVYRANHAGSRHAAALEDIVKDSQKEQPQLPEALPEEPEIVRSASARAAWPVGIAGALAVLGLVLGASRVHRAERDSMRPSGLARWSAGWGVMAVGGAAGLGLSLLVLRHRIDGALARAQLAMVGEAVEETAEKGAHLSATSYVVLGVMVTLIVAGLAWCFYRALKAAGGPDTRQTPEAE